VLKTTPSGLPNEPGPVNCANRSPNGHGLCGKPWLRQSTAEDRYQQASHDGRASERPRSTVLTIPRRGLVKVIGRKAKQSVGDGEERRTARFGLQPQEGVRLLIRPAREPEIATCHRHNLDRTTSRPKCRDRTCEPQEGRASLSPLQLERERDVCRSSRTLRVQTTRVI